jgi:hypothetical protein
VGSLARTAFHAVPQITDEKELSRRLREALNLVIQGKLNCTANLTLNKDAVSTTVSDVRAGPNSTILPMPTSATGASAFNTWWVSTRETGRFVISHVSTSTSDATATYAIFG